MKQTILFSPVGGTDPISNTNARDGSLLHICRVYHPTTVIMYMSKEILDNQAKDDRYRYCLDRLAEMQGRVMDLKIIERPDLRDVQEFDFFYQDFRKIIAEIVETMDEDDTLLLNVSSGTPAMKSGLLVLQTLGEFPCRLIQVKTPVKGMNQHDHKDYDVATLWELDEDNKDGFEDRCVEVQCPTLSAIKKEEIIKKHILVYDYQAALVVAQTLPSNYTADYLKFLQMAVARLLLDFITVDKILTESSFFRLPVQGSDSRADFEYALILDIKLKRGEYADFIRAITPLIVDLFEMILKRRYKIDISQYCYFEKKDIKHKTDGKNKKSKDKYDIIKWDRKKLKGTDILEKLQAGYNGSEFKMGPVSSIHLKILLDAYSQDGNLKRLVGELRSIEENVRNLAAHQVVSITNETIKVLTGFTGEQIMDKIKDIFVYTKMDIKPGYWASYDDMNQKLLDRIERNGRG